MRRTLFIITLSLLACSAAAAATKHRKPRTHTVVMEAMEFRPATLTVRSGDTIVWVNKDIVEHTATSATAGFDSKMIRPGQSWKYTIRARGDVAYGCTYHPTMTGTLRVK
ncbi:MAG TPA: cupredoxin family copper-binding protein [Thermoanaerobaculia bacterium]|jgi:plastocyanin